MKIVKLSKKGGLIETTTMERLLVEGFSEEAIINCCEGIAKTHKSHKFKYSVQEEKEENKKLLDVEKPKVEDFINDSELLEEETKEKVLDESEWNEEELKELVENYIPFIVEDDTFIKTEEAAIYLEDSRENKVGPKKLNLFMQKLLKEFRKYVEVNM